MLLVNHQTAIRDFNLSLEKLIFASHDSGKRQVAGNRRVLPPPPVASRRHRPKKTLRNRSWRRQEKRCLEIDRHRFR